VVQATAPFSATVRKAKANDDRNKDKKVVQTETVQFPAGSYLVRMDQPYSRIADMLLDSCGFLWITWPQKR